MSKIDAVLAPLDKVRKTGPNRWVARSPLRPDKTPSLHIRLTDDGKILLHDFGGGSVDAVVAAIGLNLADLMPDKPDYQRGYDRKHRRRIPANDLLQFIAHEATVVMIAAEDIVGGRQLSKDDLARVTKSAKRRAKLSRVLGKRALKSFHPRLFNDRLFAGETWSDKNGCHTRNQAAAFC